jgi:glycerol kinase
MESAPIECRYPQPGWVEQDAEAIWRAQIESARRVLERAEGGARSIRGIGITNQRETTIVWERKTSKPVAPAIVWQCRRTAAFCSELAAGPHAAEITRKTGLVIDAYFSGSKLRWILENVSDAKSKARDGELLFGNVDTWLIWKLTNGAVHVTDFSNASRTMLMDLAAGEWDAELLEIFGVPQAMLPKIVSSSEVVGTAAAECLGCEIPIAGIAGDQQAALFGQACVSPGMGKNTYGTGCFVLLNAGLGAPDPQPGLLTTIASCIGGADTYALEASIFVTGAAVQWLRDGLRVIDSAAETEPLAAALDGNDGVYFVPALTGLGSPHWDPHARGTIVGLTLGSGRGHLARATLEAIAYQTVDAVRAMEAGSGQALSELRADGGASANAWLMQFQADVLGVPVVVPEVAETTALGAAYLAGVGVGAWTVSDVADSWRERRRYEPRMGDEERGALLGGWEQALARARGIA